MHLMFFFLKKSVAVSFESIAILILYLQCKLFLGILFQSELCFLETIEWVAHDFLDAARLQLIRVA